MIVIEREFRVDNANHYERLDRFLRNAMKDIKLSSIYKLLRKGSVRVNGKRVRDGSYRLHLNDSLTVTYSGDVSRIRRLDESRELVPRKMPLEILFEDSDLIAIDKPPGISVHPGKGIQIITLVEGLLAYGKENGFDPLPVHRLDKHTSGVIVFAKSPGSAREMARMFREREIDKTYYTLVKGNPPYEHKSITTERDGYVERLEYRIEKKFEDASLLYVKLLTGKKHQIRRQMAELGCPVVGDDVYGERDFNRQFKKAHGLKRYFLHCSSISFRGKSGELLSISSELPSDLESVLASLK